MLGFIDIHSHILPGVDDGSKSMDETLRMLTIAYAEGIQIMIATPHYAVNKTNIEPEKLRELAKEVNVAAQELGLNLQIILGNELFYSVDLVNALSSGEALTIDGTRYILLEFHPGSSIREITSGLKHCIHAGYIPILAHTERYQCLRKKVEVVGDLIKIGVYIQINTSALNGMRIDSISNFSRKLMKKGWVHFLGTDSHDLYDRPPQMLSTVNYLTKRYGEATIRKILWDNPLTVIENRFI